MEIKLTLSPFNYYKISIKLSYFFWCMVIFPIRSLAIDEELRIRSEMNFEIGKWLILHIINEN